MTLHFDWAARSRDVLFKAGIFFQCRTAKRKGKLFWMLRVPVEFKREARKLLKKEAKKWQSS